MKTPTIDGLRLVDKRGEAWEWTCGPFDFHCSLDEDTGCWLLEQFDSQVTAPEEAHLQELECESLQDALLASLDVVLHSKSGS